MLKSMRLAMYLTQESSERRNTAAPKKVVVKRSILSTV